MVKWLLNYTSSEVSTSLRNRMTVLRKQTPQQKFPEKISWTKIPYGAMKKGPSKKREMNYNWRSSYEVCIDLCPWTIFKQHPLSRVNNWTPGHCFTLSFSVSPLCLIFSRWTKLSGHPGPRSSWTFFGEQILNVFCISPSTCVRAFAFHLMNRNQM